MTSGCFGECRIFGMPFTSLLCEWNRGGDDRRVPDDARGVPLARRVLDEPRVAQAVDLLRAVAEADLELAWRMITNWRRGAGCQSMNRPATCGT